MRLPKARYTANNHNIIKEDQMLTDAKYKRRKRKEKKMERDGKRRSGKRVGYQYAKCVKKI